MKYSIGLFCALVAVGSQTAYSEPVSHSVDLRAHVGEFCDLGEPAAADGSGFDSQNLSSAQSTFTVGINGLMTEFTNGWITFPDASCNAPSTISITRNGLINQDVSDGGDFENRIPYTLLFTFGSEYTVADGVPFEAQEVGPIKSAAKLELLVNADIGPLAKGSYQDTLVISITPNT